ncbi:hypothetical protein [Jeotgalibacillus sp. R-1-5s-1]|uniref:hypothetical protein n=1 Tax=Jeotgalibacillus sp. R-1-5s-1 TaxID=2555897 RepID=UPI00106B6AA2|nr:hypothetical protein [Jeotgalibacillus sp. R-1-5s-1]TFD97637.1 hypothetical protein E2491_09445 [Jeotgalibacillus sp. R-1-5s-1]
MTKIPPDDRDCLENAFYLPMVLKVLERDRLIIEKSAVKLPRPYLELLEGTMIAVQKDLAAVKKQMKKENMKVVRVNHDDAFTTYLFVYKGYEEKHNYFNPRLRNHVEKLLRYYLFERLTLRSPETSRPPSAGLTGS